MADVLIRPVTHAGLGELAQLCAEHASYERATAPPDDLTERLGNLLRDPDWRAWLAEADGQLLGYASGGPFHSTWLGERLWHLDCLYLRAEARGRGIGQLLLEAAFSHARAAGHPQVEWQTPEWNQDAVRFYERLGARRKPKWRFSLPLGPAATAD